jgi:hypothetical protein
MKYEVQKYIQDRQFVDEMLILMNMNGVEMLGPDVFAPDVVTILKLWASDTGKIVVARNDDNKIVGYQFWICSPHMFKIGRVASLKTVYMLPEVRGSIENLKEFVTFGKDAMVLMGFDDVVMTIDEPHKAIRRILEPMMEVISTQFKFK